MNSTLDPEFLELYARLPAEVRAQARGAYRLSRENHRHPSLQFKPLDPQHLVWSARISQSYRVVGAMEVDGIHWFWIGSHADYDQLLGRL